MTFREQLLSCRQPARRGRVAFPHKSGFCPAEQGRRSTNKPLTQGKAGMPIAYGYVTSAGALSNEQRRTTRKWLGRCCISLVCVPFWPYSPWRLLALLLSCTRKTSLKQRIRRRKHASCPTRV